MSILNKLWLIIEYIFLLPVYYISFCIPKSKNIWVFGAWFGDKYSDNSKFLYEYVFLNDKSISPIWVTRNKEIFEHLNSNGFKCVKMYSFASFYYCARAKYIFVSSGMQDVNRYVISRSIIIQLWHGTPLKKLISPNNNGALSKLKSFLFPFATAKYNYLISSSENINDVFRKVFNVKEIINTGYPRNDVLFFPNRSSNELNILYLPTFRETDQYDLFESFDAPMASDLFEKKNINFYYKLHYADKSTTNIKNQNIHKLGDIELYEFLKDVHVLITDYSSVYFDFLLTNRPVIFFPFEYKYYIEKDRQFYYNYDEVTPGPKCFTWPEVFNEILKLINNQDDFTKERIKINNYFNKFQDSYSTKRVYSFIKSLN